MNADIPKAMISAAGVASHMPFSPKSRGRTSIVISINTNDLEKARTADTAPFDRAVNIPLAKILKPINKSAAVQIRFPLCSRPYTWLSGLENTDPCGSVNYREAAAVAAEMHAITFRLTKTSAFSFS